MVTTLALGLAILGQEYIRDPAVENRVRGELKKLFSRAPDPAKNFFEKTIAPSRISLVPRNKNIQATFLLDDEHNHLDVTLDQELVITSYQLRVRDRDTLPVFPCTNEELASIGQQYLEYYGNKESFYRIFDRIEDNGQPNLSSVGGYLRRAPNVMWRGQANIHVDRFSGVLMQMRGSKIANPVIPSMEYVVPKFSEEQLFATAAAVYVSFNPFDVSMHSSSLRYTSLGGKYKVKLLKPHHLELAKSNQYITLFSASFYQPKKALRQNIYVDALTNEFIAYHDYDYSSFGLPAHPEPALDLNHVYTIDTKGKKQRAKLDIAQKDLQAVGLERVLLYTDKAAFLAQLDRKSWHLKILADGRTYHWVDGPEHSVPKIEVRAQLGDLP